MPMKATTAMARLLVETPDELWAACAPGYLKELREIFYWTKVTRDQVFTALTRVPDVFPVEQRRERFLGAIQPYLEKQMVERGMVGSPKASFNTAEYRAWVRKQTDVGGELKTALTRVTAVRRVHTTRMLSNSTIDALRHAIPHSDWQGCFDAILEAYIRE